MGPVSSFVFWPLAATLAAFCVVLVLSFAARASKRAAVAEEDPARAVYRRQLTDLDDLVERGLLARSEQAAARAEAGRRLLAQVDVSPEHSGARLAPLVVAAIAALCALGLYVWLGSPDLPDQPYHTRIDQWRRSPVNTLRPEQIAAVLRELVKQKPNDPKLLGVLGKVERAAGDPVGAVQYLQRAVRLEPNNADAFAALGDAMAAAAGDKATPEAEAALNHALEIDPNNQAALYALGGARASDGDRTGAARLWRRLAADLADSDPRRAPLLSMADKVEKGEMAAPVEAKVQNAQLDDQQANFIKGMVASLQAKLDAHPEDPAGWARLIRSYHVLGDQPAVERSLARARAQFKSQPDKLGPIETAAQ